MFLPPSSPLVAVPAAGGFCLQLTSRFGFSRTHRGRHGLCRSPGCRDDRRPADSFFKEFYTGDRLRPDHPPDRVRLCLAWLSGASDGKVAFGRISTRTRRRTPITAGNAPPAVDDGFGPGVAPRPASRRTNSPPRVPRPRPPPSTVATPAPAASPVPTVPIPSDRDRAEQWELLSYDFRLLLATHRLHLQS